MEQVVVLENLFYQRNISKIFDLKGASKNRYIDVEGGNLLTFEKALQERRSFKRQQIIASLSKQHAPVPISPNKANTVKAILPPTSPHFINAATGVRITYPPNIVRKCGQTLLDDNFVELTRGRPFPLKHRAKVREMIFCCIYMHCFVISLGLFPESCSK